MSSPLLHPLQLDVIASTGHRESMRFRCRSLLLLPLLISSLFSLDQGHLGAQTLMDIPHSIPLDTRLPTPANPSLRSLFLVGDSAVSSGPGGVSASGVGWGQPFAAFFDPSKINVVNRAVTSSSSRAYIAEGYWADTLALVKSGDIVLIQFGQNEAASSGTAQSPSDLPVESSLPGTADTFREMTSPGSDQHGTIHTFGWYLREMVVDTIARGATPILCSPAPHRDWQAGHIRQSAATYAGWTRAIAVQQRIQFVDLNRILADRYDALGEAATAPLFNASGTNTDADGAQAAARVIIGAMKGLQPDPLNGYFSQTAASIEPIREPPLPPESQPQLSLQPAP